MNPSGNTAQPDSGELRANAASIAAEYFMATSNDCVTLTNQIYKLTQSYTAAALQEQRELLVKLVKRNYLGAVPMDAVDEAIAAIDAQLNKEEKR